MVYVLVILNILYSYIWLFGLQALAKYALVRIVDEEGRYLIWARVSIFWYYLWEELLSREREKNEPAKSTRFFKGC